MVVGQLESGGWGGICTCSNDVDLDATLTDLCDAPVLTCEFGGFVLVDPNSEYPTWLLLISHPSLLETGLGALGDL